MKIRSKLLILLLAIALGPVVAYSVMYGLLTRHLGRRLSGGQQEILERGARATLQQVVSEYGEIVKRDRYVIELAVEV